MGERHSASNLLGIIFSEDVRTTHPYHSFDLGVYQYDYLEYIVPVGAPSVFQQAYAMDNYSTRDVIRGSLSCRIHLTDVQAKKYKASNQVDDGSTAVMRGLMPTNAEKQTNTEVTPPLELNEHEMYFDDLEDASSRMHDLTWPPRLDMTLPASAAARREIVKELVAAMNDKSDYQDKVGSVFKKQWLPADGETTNDHFSPQSKEKQCYWILIRHKISPDITSLTMPTLHVACART
jgi:hypothetical protein